MLENQSSPAVAGASFDGDRLLLLGTVESTDDVLVEALVEEESSDG